MKIAEILQCTNGNLLVSNSQNEITEIVIDSRKCNEKSLFICPYARFYRRMDRWKTL